jgi:hypothetical protein
MSDAVLAVLPRLTVNAAWTLRQHNPQAVKPNFLGHVSLGHVSTGLGKWTYLAARGVFLNLQKCGCATEVPRNSDHDTVWLITPLGIEVAAYLKEHWDEVRRVFRDPYLKRK